MMKVKTIESSRYLGNPNLKSTGVRVNYTPKQAEEYAKCLVDPIYFIENYMNIVNLDDGLVKFKLYDYQKELLDKLENNRFNLIIQCRQSGKSTTMCGHILHYILFSENKSVFILANKAATAREILSRIQLAYQKLPKWLQQGIVSFNKGDFELENGCKVEACSTSSDSIRGRAANLVMIDETAHIENWDEFYASTFSTISSSATAKVVLISTPKGLNHFYKFYEDSKAGRNDYIIHRVIWSDVPGRNEAWKREMLRQMSIEQFLQEQECVTGDTLVTVRDTETGMVAEMTMEDLWLWSIN